MGVLTCNRRGCDEIMCRTSVPSVGHVCRECQKEFKIYLCYQKDIIVDSHGSINKALENFMETRKGEYDNKGSEVDVDAFFREYTREF